MRSASFPFIHANIFFIHFVFRDHAHSKSSKKREKQMRNKDFMRKKWSDAWRSQDNLQFYKTKIYDVHISRWFVNAVCQKRSIKWTFTKHSRLSYVRACVYVCIFIEWTTRCSLYAKHPPRCVWVNLIFAFRAFHRRRVQNTHAYTHRWVALTHMPDLRAHLHNASNNQFFWFFSYEPTSRNPYTHYTIEIWPKIEDIFHFLDIL